VQDLEASGLSSLLASLHSTLQVLSLRDNGLRNLSGLGAVAATAESTAVAAIAAAARNSSSDVSGSNNCSGSSSTGAGISASTAATTCLSLRELSVDVNKLARLEAHELNPWGGSLQRLSVSSNQLVDWPSTSSLGGALNLPHLQRLDAHHNKLSSLPASAFIGLPRLVHLDLGRNLLGPRVNGHTLSAAKCLETLVLSQNRLEALPAPLQLPLLRKLWLGSNRLADMSAWADDDNSSGDGNLAKNRSSSSSSGSSGNSSSTGNSNADCTSEDAEPAASIGAKRATWLPSLECLYLDSNQLVCLPPGCFVGLPLLRHLDLAFNALPSEDYHHLLHHHSLSAPSQQVSQQQHHRTMQQQPQQEEQTQQDFESAALPHVAYACLSGLLRPMGSSARLVSLSLKDNPLTAHEPRYVPPSALSPTTTTPAAAAPLPETAGDVTRGHEGGTANEAIQQPTAATNGTAVAAPLAAPTPPDWERPLVTWLSARLPSLRSLDGMPLGPARRALARATAEPDAADMAAVLNAQPLAQLLSGRGMGAAEGGVVRSSALVVVPWLRALARNFRNPYGAPSTKRSLEDSASNHPPPSSAREVSSGFASSSSSSPGKQSRRTSKQQLRKGHKAVTSDADTAEEEELAMMLAEEEGISRSNHGGSADRKGRKSSKTQGSRSHNNVRDAGAANDDNNTSTTPAHNGFDESKQQLLAALWRSRRWSCSECGGLLRPTLPLPPLPPPLPPLVTTTTTAAAVPPSPPASSDGSVTAEENSGNRAEGSNRAIASGAATVAAGDEHSITPAIHEQLACTQCGTKHLIPPAPPRLSWNTISSTLIRATSAMDANSNSTNEDFGYAALEGAVASARRFTEALRTRHRAEEDADAPEHHELFMTQSSNSSTSTTARFMAATDSHGSPTKVPLLSSTQVAAVRKLARRVRHAMEVAAGSDAALRAQLNDSILTANDPGSSKNRSDSNGMEIESDAAVSASFTRSHWPIGRFQMAPAARAAAEVAAAQAEAERLAEETAKAEARAAIARANMQENAAKALQKMWRGALQRLRWHHISGGSGNDSGGGSDASARVLYSKEALMARRARRQARQHAGASRLQAWARGIRCRRKVAAAKRNCLAYDDPEVEGLLFGEGEGALLNDLKRFLDALGDSSSAEPQSPLLRKQQQQHTKPTKSPNTCGDQEATATHKKSSSSSQVAGKSGRSDLEVVAATEAAANNAAFHRTKLECLYAKVNPAKLAEVRLESLV